MVGGRERPVPASLNARAALARGPLSYGPSPRFTHRAASPAGLLRLSGVPALQLPSQHNDAGHLILQRLAAAIQEHPEAP